MTSNQKVAIVTGGSSGIGRSTAVALAKEGVKVVIAARREKEGEKTVRLIKDPGSEGIFVRTDVTNEDDVKTLVDRTLQEFGRLDYAFNNAGAVEAQTTLVEKMSGDFDKIMNVCQRLCMKYEILQMLKNKAGSIVNMASGAGLIGIPQKPLYAASKHPVLGLTKSAAIGYAKSGIRINAVAPGTIETEIMERSIGNDKQLREALVALHPIGRTGKLEEIANAVVWLLSDKASFVVGHTLSVDGGIVSR